MLISIAICTYNGADYLQEQLDSILNQTRLPDEVIICDDQSSDNTWRVLVDFKEKANFTVNLVKNDVNLGSTNNFYKAISLCSGEVVFLTDQDDVWFPSKLKVMTEIFEADQEVGMVFSDAIVTDEHLKPYPLSLWEYVGFNQNIQSLLIQGELTSKLIRDSYVTGATMAFRSKWRFLIEPPFPKDWIHDQWITFLTTLVSRVEFVPQKLIMYRQHESQQIGITTRKKNVFVRWRQSLLPERHRRHCKAYIERTEEALERISAFREYLKDAQVYDELVDRLEHWKARYNLPKNRGEKWKTIKKELELNRYHKYSRSKIIAFKDLIEK